MRLESSGAIRVGNSRVLLELVIRAFQDGVTAESICQRYPTVTLSEVYGVIAYYLRHRADIEQYLKEREHCADEVSKRIGARQGDLAEVRARLLSRKPV
jgi:uncharacterized protein (DUF433 family)